MPDERRFARTARMLGIAWIALLALMLSSLGSAYLKLGPWNMVTGLVIAAIKATIVAWLFMRLRESGPLIRLVAVAGLGLWSVLVALSGVDYETRALTPTAVQRPRQLPPARPGSQVSTTAGSVSGAAPSDPRPSTRWPPRAPGPPARTA
jgi:cytochrome c oxidase subunit 4